MKSTQKLLSIFTFVLICYSPLFGQIFKNPDKLKTWNEKYEAGILKMSPAILPVYSPDIGFSASLGLLSTFKAKRNNTYQSHSFLPIVFTSDFSKNHILTGSLTSFLYDDVIMLDVDFDYHSRDDHYYGISYSDERPIEKGDATTLYHLKSLKFSPQVLFGISNRLFAGLGFWHNSSQAKDINLIMREDPLILDQGTEIKSNGVGIALNYSNLNLKNKNSVVELKTAFVLFDSTFSSQFNYKKWLLSYKHRILLFDRDRIILSLKSEMGFGDVPWTDMAFLGGERNIIGLPMGKYRDKSMFIASAEYRYGLQFSKQSSRHHLLFQFGGGAVYGQSDSNSPVIINMAVGYLFQYQPDFVLQIQAGFADETFGVSLNFDRLF